MADLRKMLLVDDSTDLQSQIKVILKKGFEITPASTVDEAKFKLTATQYDLIVLDLNLPDGNGLEFCQELQRDDQYKKIPKIFITGEKSPIFEAVGMSMGASDFIVKPIKPDEFRSRINSIFAD
jgi:DNA-binding response OmpR family regulator